MANGHGGKRPGAGRKPGARNLRTEAQVKAAEAGGITPLEYLLSVMRDKSRDDNQRIDAAKAAAPYVHPKLQNTTHKGDEDAPIEHVFRWAGEEK